MLITPAMHAHAPILLFICPTSELTRHTCAPTREQAWQHIKNHCQMEQVLEWLDSRKYHQQSAIRDAAPTTVCKATPTAATIPAPEATVLRPGTEHTKIAATFWNQSFSPPSGLGVIIRGRKCRTSKCKTFCETRLIPTPNSNNYHIIIY